MNTQKNVGLRLDEETRRKLKYIAKYKGRSMNGQALHLVQECIREFEKTNGPIRPEDLEALGND